MSHDHDFSVDGARAAADASQLGSWVAAFLASPGSDNAVLGRQLASDYAFWLGPVELPLDRLNRLAGPPDQPTLGPLDEDDLETVDDMEEAIEDGWTPAPFVVTWQGDHLLLEDGNHRAETLRRNGTDEYWCVVGFDNEQAHDQFDTGRWH